MFHVCPRAKLHMLPKKEVVPVMEKKKSKKQMPLPQMFEWGSTTHEWSDSVDALLCREGEEESCRALERTDSREEETPKGCGVTT